MKKHNTYLLFILVGLLLQCGTSLAQKKALPVPPTPPAITSNALWKKTVSRVVDLKRPTDTITHLLLDHSADTSLFEYLVHGIKNGSLTAYKIYNYTYNEKLTIEALHEILEPIQDTITVTDPVTGAELIYIKSREFDVTQAHKYRIIEDWTFDPIGGETIVKITGIIPLQDLRIDGNYIGLKGLFFVNYTDAQKTIEKYNQLNPTNTLAQKIWTDYFLDENKPGTTK
jgi:hypothetical protein